MGYDGYIEGISQANKQTKPKPRSHKSPQIMCQNKTTLMLNNKVKNQQRQLQDSNPQHC